MSTVDTGSCQDRGGKRETNWVSRNPAKTDFDPGGATYPQVRALRAGSTGWSVSQYMRAARSHAARCARTLVHSRHRHVTARSYVTHCHQLRDAVMGEVISTLRPTSLLHLRVLPVPVTHTGQPPREPWMGLRLDRVMRSSGATEMGRLWLTSWLPWWPHQMQTSDSARTWARRRRHGRPLRPAVLASPMATRSGCPSRPRRPPRCRGRRASRSRRRGRPDRLR